MPFNKLGREDPRSPNTWTEEKMIAGTFWDARVCGYAANFAPTERPAVQKGYETCLI